MTTYDQEVGVPKLGEETQTEETQTETAPEPSERVNELAARLAREIATAIDDATRKHDCTHEGEEAFSMLVVAMFKSDVEAGEREVNTLLHSKAAAMGGLTFAAELIANMLHVRYPDASTPEELFSAWEIEAKAFFDRRDAEKTKASEPMVDLTDEQKQATTSAGPPPNR